VESYTKKIPDDELLEIISNNTLKLKGPMWLKNIIYNEQHFGFKDTISNNGIHASKTLVLAAGPESKKSFQANMHQILEQRNELTIVACDGALSLLSQFDCKPDYVVSVDAHPIIANFYKKSNKILDGVTTVLSTSIDPAVVEECVDAGADIRWIQPFFNNEKDQSYFRPGITSIKMGGNVGTTSYLLAAFALKSNPIGLMGIEFSWSDETPYNDTQYYKDLLNSLNNDQEKAAKHYVHINNPRDGRIYIADPVYYAYFLMFKEIWSELPTKVKNYTFNLTREGILNIDELRHIDVKQFLELGVSS